MRLALAILLATGTLWVLGRDARADHLASTCEELEAREDLASLPDEPLGLGLVLADDGCSLLDGGACEDGGSTDAPLLSPSLAARCEGVYGLAWLRVRSPRAARMTPGGGPPIPAPRSLALAGPVGSLAPTPVAPTVEPPAPLPRLTGAALVLPDRDAPRVVAPPPFAPVRLADGHARGLERPPRA